MIDFIFAGLIYLALMFVVLFFFSFVTIGLTYAASTFVRRCMHLINPPHPAMK